MRKHSYGFYRIWFIGKVGRLKVELDFRTFELGMRLGYDVLGEVTYLFAGMSLGPFAFWASVDLGDNRF